MKVDLHELTSPNDSIDLSNGSVTIMPESTTRTDVDSENGTSSSRESGPSFRSICQPLQ
jgi:hypothetical protein